MSPPSWGETSIYQRPMMILCRAKGWEKKSRATASFVGHMARIIGSTFGVIKTGQVVLQTAEWLQKGDLCRV
jgi:hypothetical protein